MSSESESDGYNEETGDEGEEKDFSNIDDVEQDEVTLKRSRRRTTKRQERMRSNKRKERIKEYTKIWSDFEKETLLNLLYEHGDENLEILAAGLPNKHVSQVKTYIRTISRRAFLAEKSRAKKKELIELDNWIEYLKDNFEEQVDDRIPFELFASSRDFYKPNTEFSNEVVDFHKAYEYLFALSIGRKIDVDEKTYYFVHSYLDWFIKQFEKNILPGELLLLKSSLKKLKGTDKTLTPNQVLHLIFHRNLPYEPLFTSRYLLKTVSRKIKHTNFKKGEDYDRKISLLRAELDIEPAYTNIYLDPSECNIVPFCNEVKFRNLSSFLWGALFNTDIEDLQAAEWN